MNDLNTINRLNAEAFAESILSYRKQGRYVLARYDGLHLTSIETFTELAAAQMIADTVRPLAGERVVIYAPIAAAPWPPRDQSEDRPQPYTVDELAALGRSVTHKPQHTLGDYLAAKAQLLDNSEA